IASHAAHQDDDHDLVEVLPEHPCHGIGRTAAKTARHDEPGRSDLRQLVALHQVGEVAGIAEAAGERLHSLLDPFTDVVDPDHMNPFRFSSVNGRSRSLVSTPLPLFAAGSMPASGKRTLPSEI